MEYKPESKLKDIRQASIPPSSKNGNSKEMNAADYFQTAFQPKFNNETINDQRNSVPNETTVTKRKFGTIDPNKDKLGQSLKDINLAGFSFLAGSRSYHMRIFWICLITAAVSFLLYEVWKTINDYINAPIITTYTLQRNDTLDFPKVFICPAVFINASFYANFRKETRDALKLLDVYRNVASQNQTTNTSSVNASSVDEILFRKLDDDQQGGLDGPDNVNASFTNGSHLYDFLMDLGFDEDKFFVECSFYGPTGSQISLSCTDIVSPILDERYGKCFQVDVGNLQQTVDARGLSLKLDTHSKRYITDKTLIKNYAGVFVSVNSVYDPTSYEKVLVQPGMYTKMSLSLEHYVMLDLTSGVLIQPCKEKDVANLTILNTTFTQSNCQMECIFQPVIDKCKCIPLINRDTINTTFNGTDFCDDSDADCIDEIRNNNDTQTDMDSCANECLWPCDSWRYKIRSSSAPLNPKAFEGNLTNNATVGEIAMLDVAFTRLQYLELVQQPSMTFDTFIGNAGGQITLWIGGCMLVLLPLPFALIGFLVMTCITRCKRRNKKDEDD